MMRPIKFRAWDKKEKQMINHIEKLLFSNDSLDTLVSAFDLEVKDGQNSGVYNRKVEHIELMQFTGLLDKNGTEIYEGDIVGYPSFEQGTGKTVVKNAMMDWRLVNHLQNKVVIGNVYEHPELITKTNTDDK